MSYQVIARKWRPKSFQELVGQEHIATTLLNALRSGRMPQALLFTGQRGTGKTSSARILAKSLRCPNAKEFVPCNACGECADIAQGRSLDVIEIDGASNNGVDAVRELRDTIGYMPSSGRYKVYIIDEVHMLSASAFNALLKTLEEPPPHVIFVMATTEAQKIPNTILSRCQRFDFRRIPSRQIADLLQKICTFENVKAEPEALWLLARQADGSARDSHSLLDQVITFSSGDVSLSKVIDVLGLTDRSLLQETLNALVSRDSVAILALIEKIHVAGYDPKVYAQDLLEQVRNALFVKLSHANVERIVDLPDVEIQALRDLAAQLSEEDLHLLFDMALKGVNDLLRAQDARLVLEMLLLRMAAAPRIVSLARLAQMSSAAVHDNRPAPHPPNSPSPIAAAAKPRLGTPAVPQPPTAAANGLSKTPPPVVEPVEEPSHTDPWARFVHGVRKANGLLGALLENTQLIEQSDSQLTIGIPKKMSFLIDKVREPDNIKRIESFLETFWNKKLKVEVKLADEKTTSATPKAVSETRKEAQQKAVENEIEQHPLVRSAQSAFKTQIKSIKGPRGKV